MGASSGTPTRKRASVLAETICADIEANGWEINARIGNESELLDRYKASRAVLRETIAILEYRGVVGVRRGPSGGVFVARSPADVAVRVMTAHLQLLDVRPDEVFEARYLVEGLAAALAAQRIDEDVALELRRHVTQTDPFATDCDFHDAIATVSANPLVCVTAQALRRTLLGSNAAEIERCEETKASARHAHSSILDAVIGCDAPTAVQQMSDHLQAFHASIKAAHLDPTDVDPADWRGEGRSESSERLGYQLARFIVAETRHHPIGQTLGSEPALLRRYGVSRAVLREAVRILEYDGVAEMRKGPGGGLILIGPNQRSAVIEFERFASYLRPTAHQVAELLTAIELGSLDLVIARLDQTGRDRLTQALGAEHAAPPEQFDGTAIHVLLSELTNNRVLAFIFAALRRTFLKRVQSEHPEQLRFFASHARGAHDGIVAAVLEGDRSLAQLRMREHLEQATAMFSPARGSVDLAAQLSRFAEPKLHLVSTADATTPQASAGAS